MNIEFLDIPVLQHGEGPLWDFRNQKFYCVDLLKGLWLEYDDVNQYTRKIHLNQPVGVGAIREQFGFLFALRDGYGKKDHFEDKLELLEIKNNAIDHVRFNDGTVDCLGRFFAGTMAFDGSKPVGKLYRFNSDYSIDQLDSGFLIPNGMGFDKSNEHFFMIDTGQHIMFRYDFDLECGNISNRNEFIRFDSSEHPDGMTIDADGNFWIAMWGGSVIKVFDSSGEFINELKLPVEYPTSCCFGGKHLTDLYITSSKLVYSDEDISHHPNAGRTMRIPSIGQGVPEKLSF